MRRHRRRVRRRRMELMLASGIALLVLWHLERTARPSGLDGVDFGRGTPGFTPSESEVPMTVDLLTPKPPQGAESPYPESIQPIPTSSLAQGGAPPDTEPDVSESREPDLGSACPVDMVLVSDDYCPFLAHQCMRFLDDREYRCEEFYPGSRCFAPTEHLRFCIDRYEYPNRAGARPLRGMTWLDADAECSRIGKRLCEEKEWTLACEGPGRLPYPYGYKRDKEACNIDRPYRFPNETALVVEETRGAEMDRLDQSNPSGERPACVSPFGVYDMTGNVDEWVVNPSGHSYKKPFRSGLKGGYWAPVRNQCRPITTDHNDWHWGYQIGFRCCSDPAPEMAIVKGS